MKVFIKSLLIISLLSGNVTYAGNGDTNKVTSKVVDVKDQRALEKKIEYKNDLRIRYIIQKDLIEEEIRKRHKTYEKERFFSTRKGVAAGMVLATAIAYGSFRSIRYGMKNKTGYFVEQDFPKLAGTLGLLASGTSVVVLSEIYTEAEFRAKLNTMTDEEIIISLNQHTNEIKKLETEIEELEKFVVEEWYYGRV
ncbi:MAG: hypothetical protein V4596_13790 [Bdellovibrionota bacterium]